MNSLDGAVEQANAHGVRSGDDVLPRPGNERWQPLRLGLVDLFYYDDEQFWFHDGRLLLRGNNGTGKSKVLALTLPFLLDGSIAARRVEPDADPKKRMEWNLLLGGAHHSPERSGYSWIEFGRVDADGAEHFTTLGIGLKAAAGRGIVKTWYFTSTRRIGDLRLLDDSRMVLSQERLRDELAATGSGQIHPTQEAYRRAVDETMFRLGEERYAALIDLLIQLRQPQLSKKPDEAALSAALTEALAPLDQAVVADVAESFRSLEEERTGIAQAKDTLTAAEVFLRHYRDYAKVASRRHTTAVRLANSVYEQAGRDLREAEEHLTGASEEVERLAGLQQDIEERQSTLQGQEQALRASPEMRDADRLEAAARQATDMEGRATAAGVEAEQASIRARRESGASITAARQHGKADTEAKRQAAAAAEMAIAAGLQAEHVAITADAAAAHRAVTRRRDQVMHIRRLVEAAERASLHAAGRRQFLDAAEAEAVGRTEDLGAAHQTVESTVAAYSHGVCAYVDGLSAIWLDIGLDEFASMSEGWARSMSGESLGRAALEAAAGEILDRVGRERATAEHEEEQLANQLAQTHTEIADLEAGRHPEPPLAPGRDHRTRAHRQGAPLWLLTDFSDSIPDVDRAGIEAALQSAGVLDAWIFPDGTAQVDGDVVLGPNGLKAGKSLAAALVPAARPEGAVGTTAVIAVLDRIGWGEASGAAMWVDHHGRWGSGPARGSWYKERAEFIGAGAREVHRLEMLASLQSSARALEAKRADARERVTNADRKTADVRAELDAYPLQLERALEAAHDRVAAAQLEVDRAQLKIGEARNAWQGSAQAADQANEQLADQAAQLEVSTKAAKIDVTLIAISAYAEALAELRSAARILADAAAAQQQATDRAVEATEFRERKESEHRGLRAQAASLRSRYEALQATVGASVSELQARLSETTAALRDVAGALRLIITEQIIAAQESGRSEEMVRDFERRREETANTREEKIRSLRTFTATGLLRIALNELVGPAANVPEEWNVTVAVSLSRNAEQRLQEVDESDDAWGRAQQRLSSASTELAAQMSRHGHTAFVEQRGDVLVARVRYLHDEVDIDRLADRLTNDVTDRERLLSAREREILENHLINEVVGHLHELLLTAEAQIDRMNHELVERKTSTGMQLRVLWRERPDGPAGLAAARDLMIRSDATWTPEDRLAIGDFLQAQIADVRAADPAGGWQEHLEQALDYRQWHAFVVERRQNGQWKSASGPASTGEKALAVAVPLFAAATAHYNSASPHAPRLILLDEAFAGVDDDARAKSLGLLAAFDLDVVMTSEREWACYPQVPGLSIAQLSRVEGVDAVGVTRWRWDGRRRQRVGEVDAAAQAGGGASAQSDEAALFG